MLLRIVDYVFYIGVRLLKAPGLQKNLLVNLFNGGSALWLARGRSSSTTGHTAGSGHASGHTAGGTGHLLEDGHRHSFQGLLLLLVFFLLGGWVSIQPLDSILNGFRECRLVFLGNLVLDFLTFNGRFEAVAVVLQSVLGFDAVLVGIVLGLVLFGFGNHAFNLVLRKAALVVGNGNFILLTGRLFKSRNIQNTVGVDIKSDINLRLTAGHRWNAIKVELSKDVVVLGHGTFSLKYLNQNTGLVIGVG